MDKSLLPIKDILKEAWELDQRIDMKMQKLATMKERTTHITPSYSEPCSGDGTQDRMAESIVSYVDYSNELFIAIAEQTKAERRIRELIYSVPDPKLVVLLGRRYLLYETWENIACKMNYTWQHVHRLHAEALMEVKKVIEGK